MDSSYFSLGTRKRGHELSGGNDVVCQENGAAGREMRPRSPLQIPPDFIPLVLENFPFAGSIRFAMEALSEHISSLMDSGVKDLINTILRLLNNKIGVSPGTWNHETIHRTLVHDFGKELRTLKMLCNAWHTTEHSLAMGIHSISYCVYADNGSSNEEEVQKRQEVAKSIQAPLLSVAEVLKKNATDFRHTMINRLDQLHLHYKHAKPVTGELSVDFMKSRHKELVMGIWDDLIKRHWDSLRASYEALGALFSVLGMGDKAVVYETLMRCERERRQAEERQLAEHEARAEERERERSMLALAQLAAKRKMGLPGCPGENSGMDSDDDADETKEKGHESVQPEPSSSLQFSLFEPLTPLLYQSGEPGVYDPDDFHCSPENTDKSIVERYKRYRNPGSPTYEPVQPGL